MSVRACFGMDKGCTNGPVLNWTMRKCRPICKKLRWHNSRRKYGLFAHGNPKSQLHLPATSDPGEEALSQAPEQLERHEWRKRLLARAPRDCSAAKDCAKSGVK